MSEATDYQEHHGGIVFTVEVRKGDETVEGATVQVFFHHNQFFGLLGSQTQEEYTDEDGQVEVWANKDCRATISAEFEGDSNELENVWVTDGAGFTINVTGESEDDEATDESAD